MLEPDLYQTYAINSWDDIVKHFDRFQNDIGKREVRWIFRGQTSHDCIELDTSLERTARFYGLSKATLRDREKWLLKEFERRLHHYTSDTPLPGEIVEWLALMQHYGAPTRLHDWTYSFFVACFFAVWNARGGHCEIWALNANYFTEKRVLGPHKYRKLEATSRRSRRRTGSKVEDKLRALQYAVVHYLWNTRKPMRLIFVVNPFRLNERLTIQQGVFLFPGDISRTLEENIAAEEYSSESKDNLYRLKIAQCPDLHKDILRHLYRMNIDSATLFPGLDGFAGSLKTRLVFLPEITDIDTKY